MKFITISFFFFFALQCCVAQDISVDKIATSRKGNFYAYWGWNRGWYTKSDINFTGDNYHFTLKNTIADDRQSELKLKTYLHPKYITIPQYNFRLGYFIKENYSLSFGIDHMKYVVRSNQETEISGYINESGTAYDGIYENEQITIDPDFLAFEHTDGLNYANMEYRRFDRLFGRKKVTVNLTEGIGIGVLIPRTNVELLNNARYDEFNLAGYGIGSVVGLNVTFFDHFFIQSEGKAGYIHMPNIRTTESTSDRASQHFFFTQLNILFGVNFNFSKLRKSK